MEKEITQPSLLAGQFDQIEDIIKNMDREKMTPELKKRLYEIVLQLLSVGGPIDENDKATWRAWLALDKRADYASGNIPLQEKGAKISVAGTAAALDTLQEGGWRELPEGPKKYIRSFYSYISKETEGKTMYECDFIEMYDQRFDFTLYEMVPLDAEWEKFSFSLCRTSELIKQLQIQAALGTPNGAIELVEDSGKWVDAWGAMRSDIGLDDIEIVEFGELTKTTKGNLRVTKPLKIRIKRKDENKDKDKGIPA